MSRLAGLSRSPEIIAAGRRALERAWLAKGNGKASVAFSITTAKFELRLNREIHGAGDGYYLGQSPAEAEPARPVATASGPSPETRAFQSSQDNHPASLRGYTDAVNFWDALSDDERLDFINLAQERVFAAGATLMREGGQANHVVVISSGSVRVYVRENGHQRMLAVRGPGELVGERAALEISVRSASVEALETVRALVVKTEDFAAFISDHPEVLRIVQGQIYDRLTEGPPTEGPPEDRVHRGPRPLCGQHCTVLFTDVVGFAAGTRNDLDRLTIRLATANMTSMALASFWGVCSWADRGDGLLIVIPPDVPTVTVLERLMTVLPGELDKHNANHVVTLRVQLRIAVTVGPVVTDAIGMSGEAIILAARMLEAPVFKKAIADAGAPLGVIASEFVYDMAIKHAEKPLDPARYVPVQVDVKECQARAWMHVVSPD